MKFRVNVGKFIRSITPAIDIATKNVEEEHKYANKITMRVSKKGILATSHGGTASIIHRISDKYYSGLGYTCKEIGTVTVNAQGLIDSLHSLPKAVFVDISVGKKGMVISYKAICSHSQSMPLLNGKVIPLKIAKEYDKIVKVNRMVFAKGMGHVQFAIGREDSQPQNRCLLFEANKDGVRFAAGSDHRYVVKDVEGKGIVETKKKTSIIFPHQRIANIVRILAKSPATDIVVKQAKANAQDNSHEQIIIECNGMTIVILGIDSNLTQYHDIDRYINNNYPYKISTKFEDWINVVTGIRATYKKEYAELHSLSHHAKITANLIRGYLTVEAKMRGTAKRTIFFTLDTIVDDVVNNSNNKPYYYCLSDYLLEMIKKFKIKGNIRMEFVDQATLESEAERNSMPVLIRFAEIVEKRSGVKERYYMSFTMSEVQKL